MSFTSILKKVAMAATGLGLIVFLVVHLSGNFLLLKNDGAAFNGYSHFLHSLGGLLYALEAGLVFFFLLHIYSGLRVTLENRRARPASYSVPARAGGASATLASRTMAIGGLILAFFVITHVKMFKYGDASGHDGLFGLVRTTFENPWVDVWYTVAMLALGMHLSHGFGSAFQSLGAFGNEWRQRMRRAGLAIGWVLAIGFAALPWYAYFTRAAG